MRGTHRKRIPVWADKGLRFVMLLGFAAPLLWISPTLGTILVLFYLPSYCDGAEKCTGTGKTKRMENGEWSRNLRIWHWLSRRWSLELRRTVELPPGQQYIIGLHPHGVLPLGGMINLATDITGRFSTVLPRVEVRTLAASFCFYIPLYRDLLLAAGGVDAARYNAHAVLRDKGYSIVLCPGGATEALHTGPCMSVVCLKKRRGFVKLALETGASLVPCYSFNENDAFNVATDKTMPGWLDTARKKFQAIFGISLPLITSPIPRKVKIVTVLGEAIPVERCDKPTDEQVQQLLAKFIEQMVKLYERHQKELSPHSPPQLTVL